MPEYVFRLNKTEDACPIGYENLSKLLEAHDYKTENFEPHQEETEEQNQIVYCELSKPLNSNIRRVLKALDVGIFQPLPEPTADKPKKKKS